MSDPLPGPLSGILVVEMEAIGPVPYCGLVLAEMGASVIRVNRVGPGEPALPVRYDALGRGKRSVALDLKGSAGVRAARALIGRADVVLEGYRPGVMERLGLGPAACLELNPRLVYGRMSGWGDAGPMAGDVGHDLNYLGLTGALWAMGEPPAPPPVPLNLVADFGGGAMQLACGVLAGVLSARATGRGQVVASSILEGATALTAMVHGRRAAGQWRDARGANILDGGAPFYRTYATRDGGYVAVAAIEPKFFRALLAGLDLVDVVGGSSQLDRGAWGGMAALFGERFARRTREEWTAHFAGTEACVTPVLDWSEAQSHPQMAAMQAFGGPPDCRLPRMAARFSVTGCGTPGAAAAAGRDTRAILAELAVSGSDGAVGEGSALRFPCAEPEGFGVPVVVAEGIEWVRLPLPFRLDHVNVYLIEDDGGVAVVDTGIGDATTRGLWEALLAGPLRDRRVTRIIATHFHPDHVGMAGWLAERTGTRLSMSQTEYLTSLTIQLDPEAANAEPYRAFYLTHGLDAAVADELLTNGHRYLRMITGLPRTFDRLIAGETLRIGPRRFDVLSGGGHSPEQIMLHCPADRVLLAADQVLARISPNISVQANDPEGDPLGIYLRSLAALRRVVPAETLVLPGHNLPFVGLHARLDELAAHHMARCEAVVGACSGRRLSGAELVPVVFGRVIEDAHQMSFAFSEALAHANLLLRQGRLGFRGGRYEAVGGSG